MFAPDVQLLPLLAPYRSEGKILLLGLQIAQYVAVAPESYNFTLVLQIAHY